MRNGEHFGRFRIEGFLGRGGIGDVYLAYDERKQMQVALKLIRIQLADSEMLAAEQRGVALQKKLHPEVPEVAAVYECDESDGFFYIAMEYVAGLDLSEVLQDGALPERRAARIALQISQILGQISCVAPSIREGGSGVVHGDIKPENIRLQDRDRVRLLDFGVAKSVSRTRMFTHNVFGSLPYLAPERLAENRVDLRSDLWSVGVVLYLMVAGHLPFSAATVEAMLGALQGGELRPLPSHISAELRAIIFKCLAIDPRQRYASASQLCSDLEAFLSGQPLMAGGASSETRRTLASLPSPAPATAQVTQPKYGSDAPDAAESVGRQPPIPPKSQKKGKKGKRRKPSSSQGSTRWIGPIVLGALILLVLLHGLVFLQIRELERRLRSASAGEVPALAEELIEIRRFDLFNLVTHRVARELRARLLQMAGRPFDSFRKDIPVTTQEWPEALYLLQLAERLDSSEDVSARMAFCRGQVAAIAAEVQNGSQEAWREAARELERAVEVAPEIVESYSALALLYGSEETGLYDFDRVLWALGELQSRGVTYGDREKRVLASSHFKEGMVTYKRAHEHAFEEVAQASVLEEARKHFEQSVSWCGQLSKTDPTHLCRDAAAYRSLTRDALMELGYL